MSHINWLATQTLEWEIKTGQSPRAVSGVLPPHTPAPSTQRQELWAPLKQGSQTAFHDRGPGHGQGKKAGVLFLISRFPFIPTQIKYWGQMQVVYFGFYLV